MPVLESNPLYRNLLQRSGLTSVGDFLALPAVLVSGHPDRNVGQVLVGKGNEAIPAFLKREHRVGWRVRASSAWAGFGFVSRSLREARVLRALAASAVPCPEWIAAGEDDQGRAFLVVRALSGFEELRAVLQRTGPKLRPAGLAESLGTVVARMHDAGFNQPDLYSKHVLVNRQDHTVRVLDWQRSQKHRRLDWQHRCEDLGIPAGDPGRRPGRTARPTPLPPRLPAGNGVPGSAAALCFAQND